jgi:hypothetical protein
MRENWNCLIELHGMVSFIRCLYRGCSGKWRTLLRIWRKEPLFEGSYLWVRKGFREKNTVYINVDDEEEKKESEFV